MSSCTPLMRQYHVLKAEVDDALLLFQVGDFFEFFHDDAVQAAQILHIALTARGKSGGKPIPLCGVPVHAVQQYIARLLAAGKRVAIAEQVEPAQPGVMVKREVTRVLTPGTLIDEQLIDAQTAQYILAATVSAQSIQLVFAELLSAQMLATTFPLSLLSHVDYELARFYPQEVVTIKEQQGASLIKEVASHGYAVTTLDPERMAQFHDDGTQWMSQIVPDAATEIIPDVTFLSGPLSVLYAHLRATRVGSLDHLSSLRLYRSDEFLFLDSATQKNLELIKNNSNATRRNTLLSVLDRALTGMGSRMVQKWIVRPLCAKDAIEQRLSSVQQLLSNSALQQQLRPILQQVGDLERVTGRIGLRRATVRDLHQLRRALTAIAPLQSVVMQEASSDGLLSRLSMQLPDVHDVYTLLQAAIPQQESPNVLITDGYNTELDRLREVKRSSQSMLSALERQEREQTGINSLKVGFNRVQGYYLEVTKTHTDRVPERYHELQKLVGKRRYSTPELAQLQQDIQRAEKEIGQLEQQIFGQLMLQIYQSCASLRKIARSIAHIDALWSLANAAYNQGYVRPTLSDKALIAITAGRHPVVECMQDSAFVPNDVQLSHDARTMIITGPNMGGKSTYLRQTALIAHMAHMGSFVPADTAEVGLLDRIFTRIGAGDNLSGGKSTFLVEMEETSRICNSATNRSLVILDEVGRGTSTQDGLAIAHAVVSYLHEAIKCLTLFATHYHELASLEQVYPGISNLHAACSSDASGLLFHHTIRPGALSNSFGIDVARLAGLPPSVINAAEALAQREAIRHDRAISSVSFVPAAAPQDTKELERLRAVVNRLTAENIDDLSPRKALQLFWEARELLDRTSG